MDDNSCKTICFSIGGMSCANCSSKIERTLTGTPGVIRASVSYGNSKAVVVFSREQVREQEILGIVRAMGYLPVSGGEQVKPSRLRSTGRLIGTAVIILAGMLLLRKTGIFNAIPEVETSMSYGLLFIVGIVTSLHCIAMCGGINLSQSVRPTAEPVPGLPERNRLKQVQPALLYNIGRLVSYTAVGGAAGALGSVVSISGKSQGIVVGIAGFFMIVLGLNMTGWFPVLKKITPRLPSGFTRKMDSLKSGKGPLIVGLLNGFMPCGPLQSMQIYALGTGSFFAGAASMFFFGIGTVPLIFGFGALASLLSGKFASRMIKVSALIVLFLGIGMVGRGLNLSGVNFQLRNANVDNVAVVQGGKQTITTSITAGAYESLAVQKGIPLTWTITVEEDQLNGCNNPLTVPGLNITMELVPGENIIQFTPEEAGNMIYTCWMGMIAAAIKVVEDITLVTAEDIEEANRIAAASSGSCSTGEDGASCCNTNGSRDPWNTAVILASLSTVPEDRILLAAIEDGLQSAQIRVTRQGYSPAVIVMQRRVATTWVFLLEEEDPRISVALFPAYSAQLNMSTGENTIEFVPSEDFIYFNPEGDVAGMVITVDNLEEVDMEEITAFLRQLGPAPVEPTFPE